MRLSRFMFQAYFFFLFLLATTGHAIDSVWRVSHDARSRAEGAGKDPVPQLHRDSGNIDEVFSRLSPLIKKLTGFEQNLNSWQQNPKGFHTNVNGWHLFLSADGSTFNLINPLGVHRGISKNPLSPDQLDALGRAFIRTDLMPLLAGGKDDVIVFLGSGYYRAGARSENGKKQMGAVFGHVARFSRVIHGQAVIGSGSKIALTFDSHEQIAGVSVDWPRYTEREQMLYPIPAKDILPQAIRQIEPDWAVHMQNNLKRFECGYFDNGSRGTMINLACALHHDGTIRVSEEASYDYARVEYVPAASQNPPMVPVNQSAATKNQKTEKQAPTNNKTHFRPHRKTPSGQPSNPVRQ